VEGASERAREVSAFVGGTSAPSSIPVGKGKKGDAKSAVQRRSSGVSAIPWGRVRSSRGVDASDEGKSVRWGTVCRGVG